MTVSLSGLDYDISLTALCVSEDGKRTEGEASIISTTTLPEKIRNLRLENATANSLTIKWDAPVVSSNYKYKVNISGATNSGINRAGSERRIQSADFLKTGALNFPFFGRMLGGEDV